MTGHPGDTLASALLANGVSLVGRSFKYHRPRGIFTAGVDEPNALVTLVRGDLREPNVQATMVELTEGLVAESQNRFPSLRFDVGAVNGLFGKLFSAGFYYKTFMGPEFGPFRGTRFWMACEWLIRRAAGLGRAAHAPDPAIYGRMNAFCDVLVVGAGPAGLMAARAAAASGRRVIIAEQDMALGGSANWSTETIDGKPAADWARGMVDDLSAMDNVRVLPRTTVWGRYDGGTFAALERIDEAGATSASPRQRHWVIRAGSCILASGALERPIVFPGNDRPGIMLASAAARYATRFGVLPAGTIAIFTNNDSAYTAALALHRAGARIAAIIDVRRRVSTTALMLAQEAGAEHLAGYAVVATRGGSRLREVAIQRFDATTGTLSGEPRPIEVDGLAVSGGWSPTIHLASQAGGPAQWDEALQAFLPPADAKGFTCVGACAGLLSTREAIDSGASAGAAGQRRSRRKAVAVESPELDVAPAPVLEIAADGKAFVDLQHDVTADDVRLAHDEGFVSVEHLKRYTTLGMATDQGKTSNVAGLAIMARLDGKAIPQVGTTRFRPPFAGVALGALAAERHHELRPERLTPLHDWHVAQGARMQPVGLWWRPQIYGLPGETVEQAYVREAAAVRAGVGIVDVSTLGKIAVKGPDAAAFLDRVYTNTFSTLPVGKARYGLMLREDGLAFDDGTTWRLGEHDFLMTTTTANAGKVMQHLEFLLDVVWPELRVHLVSVTDQWAGAAVAGPASRDVLAACVTGTAVDNDALPPMGIVHGEIAGAPVMICRLSFSGERAYEVYCGSGHGAHVWKSLMAAGKAHGIVPYGLESMGTLRIEKGHVTGAEIDGRTTARDLRLGWLLSKKKPFVGSAMMDREGLVDEDRLQLVGLIALDGRALKAGGHLVENVDADKPSRSIGHVTASTYSPALGRFVALALVHGGTRRIGSRAHISDPLRGRFGPVEIVSHHFFDPEGRRMHG